MALLNFIVRNILSAQTIILEALFVKLSYSNLQGRLLLIKQVIAVRSPVDVRFGITFRPFCIILKLSLCSVVIPVCCLNNLTQL